MKILYVVSRPLEINTSASIRNRATILGLVDNGHEVEVLTTEPDRNHPAFDGQMSVDDVARMHYVKLGGSQRIARMGRKVAFLRPIKDLAYRWMTRHEVYDNLKGIITHTDAISLQNAQYDLIISSSDPKSSHLFVYELLQQQRSGFKGRWIQIWGDPFASDITFKADSKRKKVRHEEHKLLKCADKIVYVSPLTLRDQKVAYPDCADKMFDCPIPYEHEVIYEINPVRERSTVNLLYCGDYISRVRDIMPLYDAAQEVTRVHLTICGDCDNPVESCENVTVYPRVPHAEVIQKEREADILVHLSNRHGSQIPGKIYQLAATNKPILFILDGASDQLLSVFGKYERFVFAQNQKESIAEAVQKMIAEYGLVEYAPVKGFSRKAIAASIIQN